MNIPNYLDHQVVDKDGYFTEPWKHIMNQLFNELQTRMSNEGHIAPSITATTLAELQGKPDIDELEGGLLYNSDTDKLIVNIDGTYKEVLTT